MALSFDKHQLGNLEYSLQREMLATNRAGGYMSTTIVCCNMRKYHGLMVCPVSELNDRNYVLLSSLDETIIQHDQSFNLALHRFKDNYEPKGHKYITDFWYTPTPTITYRVGGVILKKELLWVHSSEQLLVRYTLEQATSKTLLRLRPFLAFRDRHELSKANMNADVHSYEAPNGVMNKLYSGLPSLWMQTSRKAKFIAAPDWYYNFEYPMEAARGEEAYEDLLTTGYFEMELKAGESVVFSASTSEIKPRGLSTLFDKEIAKRSIKNDFLTAMRHSARQFLIEYQGHTMLQAGYPWYNPRSRETFISLCGCLLTQGNVEACMKILKYHVTRLRGGIFGSHLAADTQLWFFHTLGQLESAVGADVIWAEFGKTMKEILTTYRDGKTPDGCIRMEENNLIWAHKAGAALTWMKGKVDGVPVAQRPGFAVEVNALWYNAVRYAVELAEKAGDKKFVKEWSEIADGIKQNFRKTFWCDKHQYLADYAMGDYKNFEVRPNQLLAVSLKYSPLKDVQKGAVLDIVQRHLLTSRGIRTLSPFSVNYTGRYNGNQNERSYRGYHGTVIPWLLEHYVKARFELSGKAFLVEAEDLLNNFTEEITLYGVGSMAEFYDGDPAHAPGGAISFAPSVGMALQVDQLIKNLK